LKKDDTISTKEEKTAVDKETSQMEYGKRTIRNSIVPGYFACFGEFSVALNMLTK